MSYFTVFANSNNDCRILVKTDNKVEFISKKCASRTDSIKLMRTIRRNAQKIQAYKIKELECGSWCFDLYDVNMGTLIGRSESYVSKEIVEYKINELRIIIPHANYLSQSKSLKTK